MTDNKKDWLNNFIEKNAWGILLALIGVVIGYTILNTKVDAHDIRINNIEEAQIVITENQREIIRINAIQENVVDDVREIKEDVKTLLTR